MIEVKRDIYTLTENILQTTESLLSSSNLGEQPETESRKFDLLLYKYIKKPFYRHLVFPIDYLHLGSGNLFIPFLKFSVICLVLLYLSNNFLFSPEMEEQARSVINGFCLIISLVLTLCSIPSTYGFYGVKYNHVNNLLEELIKLDIGNIDQIALIESNMERVHERVRARISTLKKTLAFCWAGMLILFTQQINIVLKIEPSSLAKVFENNLTSMLVFLIVSMFSYMGIASYKKASDLMFNNIFFSLTELKNRIVENKV